MSAIPPEYLRESWPVGAQLVAQMEADICAVTRDADDTPADRRLAEQLEAANRRGQEWLRRRTREGK